MRSLNVLIGNLVGVGVFICWIAGVVLAKGFWSTLFAVCIPFWSWYLVIERLMQMAGVV